MLVKLARVNLRFYSLRDLIVVSALVLAGGDLHAQLLPSQPAKVLEASGNAPAWTLQITNDSLTLQIDSNPPEPPTRIVAKAPPAVPMGKGRSYTASTRQGQLQAVFLRDNCTDNVSGAVHPETVNVRFNDKTYAGCSGSPASLLQGSVWVVFDIAARGVEDASRVTVQFNDKEEISGRASCNFFAGHYQAGDGDLTLTATAATPVPPPISKVATSPHICAPAWRRQEAAFLQVLADVTRWDFTADGALALGTVDGRRILARRE